jgi:hypothetical protein
MTESSKVTTQEQADRLIAEAQALIQAAFGHYDPNYHDLALNRLVDCIISAAVSQVAALQEKAKE